MSTLGAPDAHDKGNGDQAANGVGTLRAAALLACRSI
jgi:hypothetical protein